MVKDDSVDKELREKIAKTCYQYANLIDDKDIDNHWNSLILTGKHERWLDCADAILAIIKEAGYSPSTAVGTSKAPVHPDQAERLLAVLDGAGLIAKERERQISQEGWTAEHDEQHTKGELALVAALYATPIHLFAYRKIDGGYEYYDPWPWFNTENYDRYNDGGVNIEVPAWDKRKKHNKLRRLVIAGALIAAEIDRLKRQAQRDHDQKVMG